MKTTIQWIDQAKAMHGLSDYALAPKLGIGKGQMSRYRNGLDYLSDDCALKLSALLGMDSPQPIIASAHAERAKNPEVKLFWERWAGVAASALLATVCMIPSPAPAAQASGSTLYIMLNRMAILA